MVAIIRFAALVATFTFASVTADNCKLPENGSCGSDAGVTCCPSGQYCQPWNAGYYQCINPPAKCSQLFTNIDFYGNDLKTVYGIQPAACCDECAKTAGCTSYTFINSAPGSPVCYLKSGSVSDRRPLVGAVSGLVNGGSTPAPAAGPTVAPPTPIATPPVPIQLPDTPCKKDLYYSTGRCTPGDEYDCCPGKQYCMPIGVCSVTPDKCSKQYTNIDLSGNDIKTVYVNQLSLCCDECAKTPGCKAYTYSTSAGYTPCYLKSGTGIPTKLTGVVSGLLD